MSLRSSHIILLVNVFFAAYLLKVLVRTGTAVSLSPEVDSPQAKSSIPYGKVLGDDPLYGYDLSYLEAKAAREGPRCPAGIGRTCKRHDDCAKYDDGRNYCFAIYGYGQCIPGGKAPVNVSECNLFGSACYLLGCLYATDGATYCAFDPVAYNDEDYGGACIYPPPKGFEPASQGAGESYSRDRSFAYFFRRFEVLAMEYLDFPTAASDDVFRQLLTYTFNGIVHEDFGSAHDSYPRSP